MNKFQGADDITMEDCLKRVEGVSSDNSYSGSILFNKDIRRVIFLLNYISKQNSKGSNSE